MPISFDDLDAVMAVEEPQRKPISFDDLDAVMEAHAPAEQGIDFESLDTAMAEPRLSRPEEPDLQYAYRSVKMGPSSSIRERYLPEEELAKQDKYEADMEAWKRSGNTELVPAGGFRTGEYLKRLVGGEEQNAQGVLKFLSPVARKTERIDAARASRRITTDAYSEMTDGELSLLAYDKRLTLGAGETFDRELAADVAKSRDSAMQEESESFSREVDERGVPLVAKSIGGAAEMVPYMIQMAARLPGVAIEAGVRYEELRGGRVSVTDGVPTIEAAPAGVTESFIKGLTGAAAEYYIEKGLGQTGRAIGGSRVGKAVGSKLKAGLVKIPGAPAMTQKVLNSKIAQLAKKVSAFVKEGMELSPAMKKASEATGLGSMTEEIFLEEGLQALVDAAGNTNNDYDFFNEETGENEEMPLAARISDAFNGYVKSLPEMAGAFAIMGGTRQTASRVSKFADKKRRSRANDEASDLLGLMVEDPEAAIAISEMENPSRKDFEKAGLPAMSAAKRAKVAKQARSIIEQAEAEEVVDEPDVQGQPAAQAVEEAPEPQQDAAVTPPPLPPEAMPEPTHEAAVEAGLDALEQERQAGQAEILKQAEAARERAGLKPKVEDFVTHQASVGEAQPSLSDIGEPQHAEGMPDYDGMDFKQLKAQAKAGGVKVRGTKKQLITDLKKGWEIKPQETADAGEKEEEASEAPSGEQPKVAEVPRTREEQKAIEKKRGKIADEINKSVTLKGFIPGRIDPNTNQKIRKTTSPSNETLLAELAAAGHTRNPISGGAGVLARLRNDKLVDLVARLRNGELEGIEPAKQSKAQKARAVKSLEKIGAAKTNLSDFRDAFPKIRRPDKSDPVYNELAGKDGNRVPDDHLSDDKAHSNWDVALEAAKEMGLVDQDAGPEALGALYRGRLLTKGEIEVGDSELDAEAAGAAYHEMLADINDGIRPAAEIIKMFPDEYQDALDTAGVEDASLEEYVDEVTLKDEEMAEFYDSLTDAEQDEMAADLDAYEESKRKSTGKKRPTQDELRKKVAKPEQGEIFGKGAVGDKFVLKQKTAVDGDRVVKERKDKADAEKKMDEQQGDMFGKREVQDLAAESAKVKKEGAVTIPTSPKRSKKAKALKSFLIREFTASGGLRDIELDATRRGKRMTEGAVVAGQATNAAFVEARDSLSKKHGKEVVIEAMQDVIYGEKSIEEFQTQFDLKPDNAAVKALDTFHKLRVKNSAKIADMLKKRGAPDEVVDKIINEEFYISRFYLKQLQGDDFVADQADVDAAVLEIQAGFQEAVDSLVKHANKLRGKKVGTKIDIIEYLQTGDLSMISHLSESRQNRLQAQKRKFDRLKELVDTIAYEGGDMLGEDGDVEITLSAAASLDAAKSTINYYLNKTTGEGGTPDMSHLKARFLEGAFRKLYREVTDPVFAAAATIETQQELIATMTMVNQLIEQGEGTIWTENPSDAKGTTVQLGSESKVGDKAKFGQMAGKYVSPELYDALVGQGGPSSTVDKVIRAVWFKPMGTMRGLKLIGPKTIIRNYVEAYVGFAWGNGDALRKGYNAEFKKANALAGRLAKAALPKTKASEADLKELQRYIELGVFSMRGSDQAAEVLSLMSKNPGTWVGQSFNTIMQQYSMLDFPTKVAAYETALKNGMTQAEAVKHVQEFYQNPDAVPKITSSVAKLGLADYSGYFVDALRIRVNQVKYAVAQAKKGDAIPALGLGSSFMFDTIRRGALALLWKEGFTKAWASVQRALRDDDEEIEEVEMVETDQERAMREFMPEWYQMSSIGTWSETYKDGSTSLFYSALGGNSAFPMDELFYGALQAESNKFTIPLKMAANVFKDRLSPGMYPAALYKMLTGDALGGNYKSTGITDVMNGTHAKKAQIYVESIGFFAMDVLGGQLGPKFQQHIALNRKQAPGAEDIAGTTTPYKDPTQLYTSMINPTRTYGIDSREAAKLVSNKIYGLRDGISSSKRMISTRVKLLAERGAVPKYQDDQALIGARKHKEYLKDMSGVASNARMAFKGVMTDVDIYGVLKKAGGLTDAEAAAVIRGTVETLPVYDPKVKGSKAAEYGIMTAAHDKNATPDEKALAAEALKDYSRDELVAIFKKEWTKLPAKRADGTQPKPRSAKLRFDNGYPTAYGKHIHEISKMVKGRKKKVK